MKFLILILFASSLFSQTTFHYNGSQDTNDTRSEYEISLLKLALDKTIVSHGPYTLKSSFPMNLKRAEISLKENKLENFIIKLSASKELLNSHSYANFPVDRGIVGYRVFFISPKALESIHKVNTLEKLKEYSIAQGVGWLDSEILKDNGFKVKIISKYESLFKVISRNRIDLFPRGINEILEEYNIYKKSNNLIIEENNVLYYPLPRFFFMHKSNEKQMQRIEEGLLLAYNDGSADKLFDKYYKKSIDFINLKNRNIYNLENRFLKGINTSYKKYIYSPIK